MAEITYLNGNIIPFAETMVSINDRAFLFGDGVYEVVRTYDGHLFGLAEHMARLERSAAALELELPLDVGGLMGLVQEVFQKSALSNAMIYLQVTRGAEPRNHLFSLKLKPNLLITVRCLPDDLADDTCHSLKAITVHDGRWDMCHVKSTSLVANIMAKHKARKAGVEEAIFVRGNGVVTEAYSSNVFIIRDGVVATHPADNRVLGGITREFVLKLCSRLGLPAKEAAFTREEMMAAGELFVTNSVHEIQPVVAVDGSEIGEGQPGPLTMQLRQAYRKLTEQKLTID